MTGAVYKRLLWILPGKKNLRIDFENRKRNMNLFSTTVWTAFYLLRQMDGFFLQTLPHVECSKLLKKSYENTEGIPLLTQPTLAFRKHWRKEKKTACFRGSCDSKTGQGKCFP